MRAIVVILALLAAAKVGYHEYLYRSASSDIIIAAYRERAMAACRAQPTGAASATTDGSVRWNDVADIRLAIGNSAVDVALWDTGSPLWSARYKNPYLLLASRAGTGDVVCEYDVVHDLASIRGL